MKGRAESHYDAPPCEVVVIPHDVDRTEFSRMLRDAGPRLSIVYVENRSGFYGSIGRTMEAALQNTRSEQALPYETQLVDADSQVLAEIDHGLRVGEFDETLSISSWIGHIRRLTGIELKLVVVHARHHHRWLWEYVRLTPLRFAGFIFSGSSYMLSEDRHTQMVRDLMAIIRICINKEIPLLGICFGMQMLALEAFDVCAEWLTVPDGMSSIMIDIHDKYGFVDKLVPGQRFSVFGIERISRTRYGRGDPVMHQANNVEGGELHSQGIVFDKNCKIPKEAVLAVSRRRWYKKFPASVAQEPDYIQRIVEVTKAGPLAYGVQLHPEMPPGLLLGASYIPVIAQGLRSEGQDLELIRHKLLRERSHHPRFYAGQRYGYNWAKRVMMPTLLAKMLKDGSISQSEFDELTQRLGN